MRRFIGGLQVLKLRSGFLWCGVLAAMLYLVPLTAFGQNRLSGDLERIVDGDTAHIKDRDGKRHKIRFLGMDTPELHFNGKAQLPWGQTATDRLHVILNATTASVTGRGLVTKSSVDRNTGKPIELEVEIVGKDVHSRDLGYIFYKGTNVNLQLTEEGLAYPYLYCGKGDCDATWSKRALVVEFLDACKQARKNKAGFWGDKAPVEVPSEFRRRIDRGKRYQYIGDAESKRLYAPNDFDKVDPCAQVRFQLEADAVALGYQY